MSEFPGLTSRGAFTFLQDHAAPLEWVCRYGCTYTAATVNDHNAHLKQAHPDIWRERVAMEDRVIISQNETDHWWWRRVTPDGILTAKDPIGYDTVEACQAEALRVNAKPYILELHAASGASSDLSQGVGGPT